MANTHIAEKITQKIISWLSLKEVKTPLSFYFRISLYLAAVMTVVMIWGPNDLKDVAFFICLGTMILVIFLVSAFAWYRPKNLVYGETGHRAEWRIKFGTESHELDHKEVEKLRGTPNPEGLSLPSAKNPD